MMTNKSLGSAHQGAGEWLIQRVTSFYMAGFVVFLFIRFVVAPVHNYAEWVGVWRGSVVRIFWLLFWVSLFAHAWIGMRSVWMDYLKPIGLRLAAQALTAFGLLGLALWLLQILA